MPKSQANRTFIALGSNLHNSTLQIQNAILALKDLPNSALIKVSSLYQSAPVGYLKQPDFINAVAEMSTQLSPLELLDALLNIEKIAGRERTFANAPRVLDCDLLLYDDVVMQSKKLTLPHPRMHMRGFVLLPLAEIAPDLVLHNSALPYDGNVVKLAELHHDQGIKKLQNSDF